MEHIYKNHMLPAASRKSYFTTSSRTQVRNLVLNTIVHPAVVEPNQRCADKVLYKKRFANNIGRHGASGLDTNHICVVRKSNNHIITAYPILWVGYMCVCTCVCVFASVCVCG